MRWLISLLFVALVAIALAIAGRNDPGYVVLVYPPWRAEISFISFVIALTLLVGFVALMLRFIAFSVSLPERVRERRAASAARRADERFVGALGAWVDQRYGDAADAFEAWRGDAQREGIARVLAARAAGQTGDVARRDRLLEAASASPAVALGAQLVSLEAALQAKDTGAADRALARLRGLAPAHPSVLRLELRLAQLAGRWEEAANLVDRLEHEKLLAPEHALPQRRAALVERLRRASGDTLAGLWKSAPAALKAEPQVARVAAERFLAAGAHDQALEVLESALAREWDENLARLFGSARGSRPERQIEQAEKWLVTRPRDAQLLLALAELCSRIELWGKAQSYLEASLGVAPTSEAHYQLAALREKSGMHSEALRHYKEALALSRAGG